MVFLTVFDLRHTDVIVISKFLTVDTTVAVSCDIVVSFALRNDRYTLIQIRCIGY